ncbi:hypothetical protein P692DRAFT_20877624, partial [Suillus brevipes Sb2]
MSDERLPVYSISLVYCGGKISSDLTKDVLEHHLHLHNGILEFVTSLCAHKLDTISTDRLSKIISAMTKGKSDTQSTAFSSVTHKGLNQRQIYTRHCTSSSVHATNFTSLIATQRSKIKMAATSWPTGFYKDSVYDLQVQKPHHCPEAPLIKKDSPTSQDQSYSSCRPGYVEAPPVKKKMVPPPKAKRTQLVESDDDTEDIEAPPVKKRMVPPPKTKCTQVIKSDKDIEDVE